MNSYGICHGVLSKNINFNIGALSWENLFMFYVNNKSAAQPAYAHSVISVFVILWLDNILLLLALYSEFQDSY